MAKAFKYGLKGITGYLEPAERELLRSLFADVISMLEPEERANQDPLAALVGLDAEAREPTDRALRRLLPNVMKNDDEASLEFRRYTERSLRESKIGALKAAALGLDKDELLLTPADARHWSAALNDVRLVLAERLDIRDDADAEQCPPHAGLVPGRRRGKLPGPRLQLHDVAAGVPGPGNAAVAGDAQLKGIPGSGAQGPGVTNLT